MDEQLKHRLVGAAVIMLLAVIVVPLFFEDKTPRDSSALPDAMQERILPLPPPDTRDSIAETPVEATPPSATPKPSQKSQKYEVISLDEAPSAKPQPRKTESQPTDTANPSVADSIEPEAPSEAPAYSDDGVGVDRPAPRSSPKAATPSRAPPPARSLVSGETKSPARARSGPGAENPPRDIPPPTRKAAAPATPAKSGATVAASPSGPRAGGMKADPASKPSPRQIPADSNRPVRKQPTPAKAETGKPARNTTSPENRWTVQVGTFADESNARKLVEKLQKRNLPVRLHVVQGGGGKVYRVTVGPSLDRTRAETIQKQLSSQDGVKGMILQTR